MKRATVRKDEDATLVASFVCKKLVIVSHESYDQLRDDLRSIPIRTLSRLAEAIDLVQSDSEEG